MTYATLKSDIASFLNRDDLTSIIPTFISNAENSIYRQLNHRLLEKTTTFDRTSESPVTDTLALPSDYRETILLTSDGTPLERVSLDHLKNRTAYSAAPEEFARDGTNFQLWPFPDVGRTYKLTYYYKPTSLTAGADSGTNDLLTAEPALYLYASLLEAEPYLRTDQMPMMQIWATRYVEIMTALDTESAQENYSGSTVEVKSTFSGRL